MIREWLKRRRQRAANKRWDAGYEWAAGRLLSGIDSPADVRRKLDGMPPLEFDLGALKACDDWRKKQ